MSQSSKILVTGAGGQLGKELEQLAATNPSLEFVFLTRDEFPIDDEKKLQSIFATYQPDFLINCAAYTAVDKAESEKEAAFRINADAVALLATSCKENNTRFLHISTDYVFDGTSTVPYKENATTNPQTVYGASKLKGEKLALQHNPETIIIRTSWVYSAFGKNFVKTMLRLFDEKESVNVVNDQFGSPTYAADLAEAILHIILSGHWKPGIYHFSNNGIVSWFDFAQRIKSLSGSPCKVNPIPTSSYPTPAKRPAYSVLDNSSIQQTYGIKKKGWEQSLSACLLKMKPA